MSKLAVVTAASRGIGAATAIAFGQAGYDVVVNYNRSDAEAKKVAEAIKAAGQTATLVQANVFTEAGIDHLFNTVKQQFGHIDVLVNNAGYASEAPFGQWTTQAFQDSLAANLMSAALSSQAAVPLMKEGSSILFNSSIYGMSFGGNPNVMLYSASKAAIVNLTQTMAERLAPLGIRCNVVAPGVTKTPAWDDASPEYVKTMLGLGLQHDWVEPQDIAAAFVFLAQTPHINAETIVVDNGWLKKIRPVTNKH